jgi:hypothetical protein
MRRYCGWIAALALLFCMRTHAAELLSYKQMAKLPKNRRARYINDVRHMLGVLEEMQIKAAHMNHTAAFNPPHTSSEIARLRHWLALIPEAAAADDSAYNNPGGADSQGDGFIPSKSLVVYPVYYGEGKFGCVTNAQRTRRYEFNTAVATCIRSGSAKDFVPSVADPSQIRRECDKGEAPVYTTFDGPDAPLGRSYCAAETSLEKMDRGLRDKLIAPASKQAPVDHVINQFGHRFVHHLDGHHVPDSVFDEKKKENIPMGYESVVKDVVFGNAGPSRNLLMKGDATAAAKLAGVDPKTVRDQAIEAKLDEPVKVKAETVKNDKPPMYDSTKFAPAGDNMAAGEACEKISDADRAKLRSMLAGRSGKPPVCFNAGSFSVYMTAAARPGECRNIASASWITNAVYAGEDGEVIKDKKGKPAKGCGASRTLCEPLVYCDTSDTAESKTVKLTCVSTSGSDEDHASKAFTRLCSKLTSDATCDPEQITGPVKDHWSEASAAFKTNYDAYCVKDENYKKFFCNECKEIGTKAAGWLTAAADAAAADADADADDSDEAPAQQQSGTKK